MGVIHPRCCGIDALPTTGEWARAKSRRFDTMTTALPEQADWLHCHRVTEVAMESADVYWKPERATRQERAEQAHERCRGADGGEAAQARPAERQFRAQTSSTAGSLLSAP